MMPCDPEVRIEDTDSDMNGQSQISTMMVPHPPHTQTSKPTPTTAVRTEMKYTKHISKQMKELVE